MAIAKGSAAFGHEKQMTANTYLRKCAKAAMKDGESEEKFVSHFKESAQAMASAAYKAETGGKAKDELKPVRAAKKPEVKCTNCGNTYVRKVNEHYSPQLGWSCKQAAKDAVSSSDRAEFKKLDAKYPNLTDKEQERWGKLADRLDRASRKKDMGDVAPTGGMEDRRIGGKEAKAIHALLKGRTRDVDEVSSEKEWRQKIKAKHPKVTFEVLSAAGEVAAWVDGKEVGWYDLDKDVKPVGDEAVWRTCEKCRGKGCASCKNIGAYKINVTVPKGEAKDVPSVKPITVGASVAPLAKVIPRSKRPVNDEDLSGVRKRYDELKTKSREDLHRIFSRSHRINNAEKAPKSDLIAGIMEAEFGAKKYEAAFAQDVRPASRLDNSDSRTALQKHVLDTALELLKERGVEATPERVARLKEFISKGKTARESVEKTKDAAIGFSVETKSGKVLGGPYADKSMAESAMKDLQARVTNEPLRIMPAKTFGRGMDVEPVSPFDVDTDAKAAKLIKQEGKTMTSAEIARKYGFSLSFVKEVLGETGKGSLNAVLASRAKDIAPVDPPSSSYRRVEREYQELSRKGLTGAELEETLENKVGASAMNMWKREQKEKGNSRDVAPVGAKDAFPIGPFSKQEVEAANKKIGYVPLTKKEKATKVLLERRSKDVAPVGDAEGTHKVSYKLNGPTAFEINSSQFIEWARKNKKEIGNFATRLKALQEFTGDPRIKDWET